MNDIEEMQNDISDLKEMVKEILVILEETASKDDRYSIRARREHREGIDEDDY